MEQALGSVLWMLVDQGGFVGFLFDSDAAATFDPENG